MLGRMNVIVTGVTGMVGEGVLLSCLENPAVERVLALARRPSGHTHPKLREQLVQDFRDVSALEAELKGYEACFYCAGISSVGMTEADYAVVTYDTPLRFAETLLRLNPGMVLTHISGAHTDGTESGKVMWARVKGKAENALLRLPFKGVYNFRISLTKPTPGQRYVKGGYTLVNVLYPLFALFFPGISLRDLGRAMVECVRTGAPRGVLEVPDIRALIPR
jgi:uncharacterized protein YbjT (DUF2867 family)